MTRIDYLRELVALVMAVLLVMAVMLPMGG